MGDIPIACILDAIPADRRARHQGLYEALIRRCERVDELSNGYRLHLPADERTLVEVAEWISLERLCCPILNFALEIPAGSKAVWLSLTGEDSVKAFLAHEAGLNETK